MTDLTGNQQGQTMTVMPRYKCHKEVWALKIKSIEYEHMPRFQGAICRGAFGLGTACGSCEKCKWEKETDGGKLGLIITPEESGFAPFKVSHEYAHKHKPLVGGYFVQYSDGYKSFSPAGAFEEGYALLSGPRTAFESNMLADLSDDQIIQRHGNCSHLGWQEDARTFSEELAKRLRERESEVKRLRKELGQEIKATAAVPPVLQQIAEATGGTIEQWEKRRIELGPTDFYFEVGKIGDQDVIVQTIVRELPAEQKLLDEDEARINLIAAVPDMSIFLLRCYTHISHGAPTRAELEEVLKKAGLL